MKITKEMGVGSIHAMRVLSGDAPADPIPEGAWAAANATRNPSDSAFADYEHAMLLFALCAAIAGVRP